MKELPFSKLVAVASDYTPSLRKLSDTSVLVGVCHFYSESGDIDENIILRCRDLSSNVSTVNFMILPKPYKKALQSNIGVIF
jgi:hypothetical protein